MPRSGTSAAARPTTLAALGRTRGFEVVVVPPFDLDGRHVRSTEVRAAITAGDLDGAARLLGRTHAVVGEAMPSGEGSGSRLGFALPVALPPDGRYAVRVETPARVDAPASPMAVAQRTATVDVGGLVVDGPALRGAVRVAFERAV